MTATNSNGAPSASAAEGCGTDAESTMDDAAQTAARKRRRRRFRWIVRAAVLILVAGYLKFVGLDSKFYYPNNTVYAQPHELGLTHEDVTFTTSDGLTLSGWFLPAQGNAKGLVVHFHGNAANITAHLALVDWLPRAGYHVLMFDYRGYGQSGGHVTRAGTILDGHAAIDYALTRPEAQNLPLFAYGQSLGGAVAIVVAAERPEISALVAESAFGSYRHIAARHIQQLMYFNGPSRLMAAMCISAGHDPLDVVGRLAPRPILVIAAENDSICFPDLSRELFKAAGEPKSFWLVPRAEHLGIIDVAGRELTQRITTFFANCNTGPSPEVADQDQP